MNTKYRLLLGLALLHLLVAGCYADRISISGLENQVRLTWKRIGTVCMKRDLFITYRILYNADRGCCPKLLLYSDQQYQKMVFMKSLEMIDRGQDVHDEDVFKKLYVEGSSLMNQVQRRLESSYSCAQIKRKQMQVLDPSQVVNLCPTSGISIGNQGQSYRSCTGGVKLTEQVSLPNHTIAESWYGRKENHSVNVKDEHWTENTWHIALTNCPSNGPLRISYHIIIDSVNNLGKPVTNKSYEDPMLESWCPRIMLPYELSHYAPQGGAQRPINSVGIISACILFFYKLLTWIDTRSNLN